MAIKSKENFFLKSLRTQIPAMLCLEHLHSEYSSLKSDKKTEIGAEDEEFIDSLYERRETTPPTWHDLYRFELILANYLPAGKLRGKVVRLRYDYRNVAGQKEFDDYMASKPPDLQSPPDPEDPPDKHTNFERLMRDDLKDLLDRLYMRYAILPVKEKKLNKLTFIAAGLCLVSLISLLIIVTLLFAFPHWFDPNIDTERAKKVGDISSLTIMVVVVTGAMGGFVSALQRIQTQPADGDSIYNLSVLFYGSYSVFVAPITGAIFAILLYLMFTSQVLTGAFFPRIYTPAAVETSSTEESKNPKNKSDAPAPPTPETHQTNTANTSSSAAGGNSEVAETDTKTNRNVNANTNVARSPTPKPTPEPVPEKSLKVLDFLVESGPAGGKDYALLILWCFIAGFAERFVPDALDRFIKRSDTGGGGKT